MISVPICFVNCQNKKRAGYPAAIDVFDKAPFLDNRSEPAMLGTFGQGDPVREVEHMKGMILACVLVFAAVPGTGTARGGETASIDRGKELFNDSALGTNGKTCNTCHPKGKGLERAGSKNDLVSIINGCITVPLKGKALDPRSVDMQSLVLYINSLSSK